MVSAGPEWSRDPHRPRRGYSSSRRVVEKECSSNSTGATACVHKTLRCQLSERSRDERRCDVRIHRDSDCTPAAAAAPGPVRDCSCRLVADRTGAYLRAVALADRRAGRILHGTVAALDRDVLARSAGTGAGESVTRRLRSWKKQFCTRCFNAPDIDSDHPP